MVHLQTEQEARIDKPVAGSKSEQPQWLTHLPEITGPRSAQASDRTRTEATTAAVSAPVTKEPYSPDVSAAAFREAQSKLGINLLSPEKWSAKTPEQKWWTQAMAQANEHRDELPPSVQIKAMAAVGYGGAKIVNDAVGTNLKEGGRSDSMYLAGSIAKSDEWNAKAKVMDIRDANGNVVQNPNRTDGKVDSIYKSGKVYDVDGTKVFEIHDDKTGGRTFAVADPGNLKGAQEYNEYTQKMINKALQTEGRNTMIEFPAYEKKVSEDLTGILGMGVKGTNLYLAQAKMDAVWAANKDGKLSFERQAFEVRSRGLHMDPPAEQLNRDKFMVAETTNMGRVYMSARFSAQERDLKVPDIAKLKAEYGIK